MTFLTRHVRQVRDHYRHHGLSETLRKIVEKTVMAGLGKQRPLDATGLYRFTLSTPIGQPLGPENHLPPRSLNWFIPAFSAGGGGHLNIFRLVNNLAELGFESRLVVLDEKPGVTAGRLRQRLEASYFPVQADIYVGVDQAPPAAVAVATAWQTAYTVRNFLSCRHRAYFVQDFEPYFYPAGPESTLAEQTYHFGFYGLTAGSWLAEKLANEYNMPTTAMGFSYDKDLYRPISAPVSTRRRLFFFSQPGKARRCFDLGLAVLTQVYERLPDLEVVMAGANNLIYDIPFPHENVGLADLEKLAGLYSSCQAALIFSMTNASLLPYEVMACGTPVVSNTGPWVEWLLDSSIAVLAEPTVEAMRDAVLKIMLDDELRKRLRDAGLAKVTATDWFEEARKVAAALERLINTERN